MIVNHLSLSIKIGSTAFVSTVLRAGSCPTTKSVMPTQIHPVGRAQLADYSVFMLNFFYQEISQMVVFRLRYESGVHRIRLEDFRVICCRWSVGLLKPAQF